MVQRVEIDTATLGSQIAAVIGSTSNLEDACVASTALMFRTLPEMALVRIFLAAPMRMLDGFATTFARDLAERSGRGDQLRADTPVLALMGSHGIHPDWCSRRTSVDHVAIPLLSSEFAGSIPMISRALDQLELGTAWLDHSGKPLLQASDGRNVFYVAAPEQERDELGRLVIPGQEFVRQYQIRTVFGLCTQYSTQTMPLILLAFSRAQLPIETVWELAPIMDRVRSGTEAMLGRGVGTRHMNIPPRLFSSHGYSWSELLPTAPDELPVEE
jgi:hypothetical protein